MAAFRRNLFPDGRAAVRAAVFRAAAPIEKSLRAAINRLWLAVEWNWYSSNGDRLYWHWSPHNGWAMNHIIVGWNECLITYILACASPTHPGRLQPIIAAGHVLSDVPQRRTSITASSCR